MQQQLPPPTRPNTPPSPIPSSSAPSKREVISPMAHLRALRARFIAPLSGPVRLAIVLLMSAALVAISIVSIISLSGGVESRSLEQHLFDSRTDDLNTSLVGQSFRSHRANLSRIDLQLQSIAPRLPHSGKIQLLKGDGLSGQPIYSAPLDSASFANNPYLTISFPPIAASEGMTYTLTLETPGAPLSATLGINYNSFDALSSGKMYTDAGAGDGDLVISAYYHYTPADTLTDLGGALANNAFLILCWVLLLFLPGLALLAWIPSRLSAGQRLLAAPGVTALALPVFFLVTRSIGLPFGGPGMWLMLVVAAVALGAALVRNRPSLNVRALRPADFAFWSLLAVVAFATVFVRLLSLRDATAGMGLDAYHHTLIAQLFVQSGGVPSSYEPFAPLASFTYHYGFHALIACVAWLSGLTTPTDMMSLMPQAGQIGMALPVLTLALFAWRALNNRWAGLLAGAFAGLYSIFPAYYVNWSRYTQGLGLALLPVAWVLMLEALDRPLRSASASITGPPEPTPTPGGPISWQYAMRRSGPYMLAVIGAAGLFLTHYRIAMIYAAFLGLYLFGALLADLRARKPLRAVLAPVRRTGIVAALTLAALSPWLINLSQNFHSHLVGKDNPNLPQYYELGALTDLLFQPQMLLLFGLAAVGLVLVIMRRAWALFLLALTFALVGLWSNPYLFKPFLPNLRLPYSGYLDSNTWAQSLWLPLALLAGYAVATLAGWALSLANKYAGLRPRLWRASASALMGITLLLAGAAIALPIAATVDLKPYITSADAQALMWMRDNLPRNAYVLANPFAFEWAGDIVYGSDAGMWVPLVAGVRSSVPPLPAYNERPQDEGYLPGLIEIIGHEPFQGREQTEQDWQALKDAGITDIFVGSRGGALDVPALLKSNHTRLLYHRDAVWLFALR